MSYFQRIKFFHSLTPGLKTKEIQSIGRHNALVEAFFIALTGYEIGHKMSVHADASAELDYFICKSFRVRTLFQPAIQMNPAAERAINDILSLKLIHAIQENPKFRFHPLMHQRKSMINRGFADDALNHFGSSEWPDYLSHILSQLPCGWRRHMTLPILRAYWNQAYYDCEPARILNEMMDGSVPNLGIFDYLALESRYRQELFPADLPKPGGGSNGAAALEAA